MRNLSSMGNMAGKGHTLLLLLLIILVGISACLFIKKHTAVIPLTIEDELTQLNKSIPLKLTDNTEMIGVTSENKVITFTIRYTELNRVTSALVINDQEEIRNACKDRLGSKLLKDGYTLMYEYLDQSNRPIGVIRILLRDCP